MDVRGRIDLIREHSVDVVLDVGANEGRFALALREAGYKGRIVSFEPLSAIYPKLEGAAAADPAWETLKLGLGARSGVAELNVAANKASSSFLPMLPELVAAEPRVAYVATEQAPVKTLDELDLLGPAERAYLKLDVQGYELEVLAGAERAMRAVEVVDAELSLVELYEGAPLLEEVVRRLDGQRFALVAVEPAFTHPRTGALLQLDGLFRRYA